MKRAKILSASAGSGKTFQLALKYICDIIERPDAYRNILAVTFTNKATEEMKSRILREIHVLASGKKSDYLDNIREKMGLSEEKIRSQALIARNKILHDYSRFNVLTIDKFFQRILRAFIKELGLDLNYEIELDTDMILQRSAESLVNSIPTDNEVRKWLFEFAEERLNDGEKWDIRRELCGLGQQLFGESGAKRMKKITKDDLREIIKLLYKDADDSHQKIKNWGQQALDIMKEYGVDASMFKYGNTGPAGYFGKYAEGELKRPTA
ncbi:MAG: UvrD-helicase domain-containing protein, partial [Alistipes sp.]|nr:UvrD-helicase domain-containing protein [Alistipes sp.]